MSENIIAHGASFGTTLYDPKITPPPEEHAVLAVWLRAGSHSHGLYQPGSQKWEASAFVVDGSWWFLKGKESVGAAIPDLWAFLPGDPLAETFSTENL